MTASDLLINAVQKAILDCPLVSEQTWGTFVHTTTGNNVCHPRTMGLLAKAAWSLPNVAVVEIDVRINLGSGIKFQPDLLLRSVEAELLAVDFESPNSSDARIPIKDIAAYLNWAQARNGPPVEYLIITSLPDGPAPNWQLRWAARGQYNHGHSPLDVRLNPSAYWYARYTAALNSNHPDWRKYPIAFANIDGKFIKKMGIARANTSASSPV